MLPAPIYRLVPVACVFGGLFAVINIGNKLGTASGLLLFVTGLIIFALRIANRKWEY